MQKKILFAIAGPRLSGTSAFAARTAAEAARAAGCDVTIVELPKLKGSTVGCIGCHACQQLDEYRCVLKDDMTELVATLPEYDTVIIASPVYFFSLPSQAKAFIDRLYCLVKYEDGEPNSMLSQIRFGAIITSGGDEKDSGIQNIYSVLRNCAEYSGAPEPCFLHYGNCHEPEEFRANPVNAAKAIAFGRAL